MHKLQAYEKIQEENMVRFFITGKINRLEDIDSPRQRNTLTTEGDGKSAYELSPLLSPPLHSPLLSSLLQE
jgi:hypothetical protein